MMSGIIVLVFRILIILSLYAFLFLAIYMIWKNIEVNSREISKIKIPKIILSIDDQDMNLTQEFTNPEVIIGRDPQCDLSISRETVSAHHARLSYHHKNWWIDDMLSTNGTILNEEQVKTATVLVDGDTVICGDVPITINIEQSG